MSSELINRKISCAADFEEAASVYRQYPCLYKHTNCLSYALGVPELGMGVPGHLASAGQIYGHMCHADYMRKLMAQDGLVEIDHDDLIDTDTQVIGVVVKEYLGGHIVKYHKDGTWSHQGGMSQPITNKDCDGKIITDPRNANFGFYDEFVGYFKVPDEGLSYIPRIEIK